MTRARWLVLALAFAIPRLYQIDAPLVDMHSVRQTQTAMITRNLLEDRFDVLHTRIDWAGDRPGYVIQEFPLYQAVVAAVWVVAGEHDIAGRLVSLLFCVVAAVFLYRLAARVYERDVAYWATLAFLLCPLVVFVSRAFMMNMATLALGLVATERLLAWRSGGLAATTLVPGFAALLAGWLMNEPLVFGMAGGLLWAVLAPGRPGRRDVLAMSALATVGAAVTVLWLRHAGAVNAANYPEWGTAQLAAHLFGQGVSRVSPRGWFRIAAYLGYLVLGLHGAWLVLRGLAVEFRAGRAGRSPAVWWIAGSVPYVLLFFKALTGHNYYSLPLVPGLALAAGFGASAAWRSWWVGRSALRRAAAITFAGTAVVWIGFPLAHAATLDRTAYAAGTALSGATPAGSLVVVAPMHTDTASEAYPTILYYARRRGWNVVDLDSAPESDSDFRLSRFATRGARYMVVTRGPSSDPTPSRWLPLFSQFAHDRDQAPVRAAIERLRGRYPLVLEREGFLIFRLEGDGRVS